MTGKFWSTILLLFYMEAIYLPTLKVVVQNYNMMRFNRLWLTQIYLYQFYIPELIQLANDIEVNPGPEISTDSLNLEDPNKKNYFFIEPWNTECQAFWCSALDLPLLVKHKNCSEMVKPLEKPSKLYRILGDGNCLFHALSYAITERQNYHSLVREKIVQHIRHKEHALLAHMNGSVNEYLARTGMTNQHVWGTDIHLHFMHFFYSNQLIKPIQTPFHSDSTNYHTSWVHLSVCHTFLPKPRISSVLNCIVEN